MVVVERHWHVVTWAYMSAGPLWRHAETRVPHKSRVPSLYNTDAMYRMDCNSTSLSQLENFQINICVLQNNGTNDFLRPAWHVSGRDMCFVTFKFLGYWFYQLKLISHLKTIQCVLSYTSFLIADSWLHQRTLTPPHSLPILFGLMVIYRSIIFFWNLGERVERHLRGVFVSLIFQVRRWFR